MEIKTGFLATLAAFGLLNTVAAAQQPIALEVDATDVQRCLLHAKLHIPVKPGKLTLYYPKWIPGEHGPTGPINDVADLRFFAADKPVDWERDADEMCTFHVTIPDGVDKLDVALDLLLPSGGGSSTPHLLDLNWNQILLYPQANEPLKTPFVATLKLPANWQFDTALPVAATEIVFTQTVRFSPAPLETLIDSPVIAGQYFRTVELTPGEKVQHFLHIVADDEPELDIKPADIANFTHLVKEANAMFGAHHYRDYHFLLTVSDHVEHFGLEHHESSDDRVSGNYLTDADARKMNAELLPHEMVHSWNGKYRRPAGLATPDYQQPMRGELLWVYEGLTDYYGKVLATRAGLQTNEDFEAMIALNAAMLDHRSGRQWRSLADTAVAAQLLYAAHGEGTNRRRGVDFYPEGDLIWLEVDTLIRQQTQGKKSLDDFCKKFHGGESGAPKVVPYTLDDIVKTLNEVAPGDWKQFFTDRVYAATPHAPLGGIENGGWHLAYTNEVPAYLKSREGQRKYTDMSYSLGISLGADGNVTDVIPGSPADHAGFGPAMKIVAVNGHAWSAKIMRDAVKSATTNAAPVELLTEFNDFYKTYSFDYHEGEKYPVLERDETKPDLIADIVRPLTPAPPVADDGKK